MLGHSIVSQNFMELEGSIPNSQELSTCSYPGPDQSSQYSQILFCTHLRLGLLSGLYLFSFPTNNIYAFLFSPFVLLAPPI
jgi:hypothetical protein